MSMGVGTIPQKKCEMGIGYWLLGMGITPIPKPNTPTQNYIWYPKKIVYWVFYMGIGMIPIPNTFTQYTQFLSTKYNFGLRCDSRTRNNVMKENSPKAIFTTCLPMLICMDASKLHRPHPIFFILAIILMVRCALNKL